MPMVLTSVAVATPSTTAARIRKAARGPARRPEAPQHDPDGRAAHAVQVLGAAALPGDEGQDDGEHDAGQQAAGEQGGDGDAGDGADGDEHEGGRDRLGHGAGGGEEADHLALVQPALLHLREQHGGDGGHVRGLGAGDAADQEHGAEQHVLQAAADVAEQVGEEGDHHARHARDLDQQAEQDEERDGEQDQAAHPLLDAARDDGERSGRGAQEVSDGREREAERDGHAGQHEGANEKTKNTTRFQFPAARMRPCPA